MKKILIINGHPDPESYCYAIHNVYKKGVLQSNAELKEINVGELQFNPNLELGVPERVLEGDVSLKGKQLKTALLKIRSIYEIALLNWFKDLDDLHVVDVCDVVVGH